MCSPKLEETTAQSAHFPYFKGISSDLSRKSQQELLLKLEQK